MLGGRLAQHLGIADSAVHLRTQVHPCLAVGVVELHLVAFEQFLGGNLRQCLDNRLGLVGLEARSRRHFFRHFLVRYGVVDFHLCENRMSHAACDLPGVWGEIIR